jgi:predicted kinase
MAGTTVRVSEETRRALRELAHDCNQSMQEVLAQAVEAYRRQRLLALTNEAYARLRAEPDAWRELEDERASWNETLSDGLEPECDR